MQSTWQWHRRVWLLALPIILSNVTVPLVGAADTAVMGHLDGAENIAAVALGASIFSLVFWTFGFLRMGSSGLIAQSLGASDDTEIQLTLLRYLGLSVLIGLMVLALRSALLSMSFWLLDADAQLVDMTSRYFDVRIWSAPATFANYVLLGAFVGLQQTRWVLAFQLLLNLVNISLDLIFVLLLGYGIEGVAAASVISDYTALLFGLYLLRSRLRSALAQRPLSELLHAAALTRMLNINANIFLRTLLLVGSFFYFHAASARLGTLTLAANAVLLQLLYITAYALDGFAHAAETLTGQAVGARNKANFKQAVATSTFQSLAIALIMSAILLLFGAPLIRLFTNQPDVSALAIDALPWLVAMPLLSVWSYQLDGIFIGATRTAAMRNGMLVSTSLFIALTELLGENLSNHSLWLTFAGFSVLRAITLGCQLPAIARQIDPSR